MYLNPSFLRAYMTTPKWSMCQMYKIYASLVYLLNFAGFEGKKVVQLCANDFSLKTNKQTEYWFGQE